MTTEQPSNGEIVKDPSPLPPVDGIQQPSRQIGEPTNGKFDVTENGINFDDSVAPPNKETGDAQILNSAA